MRLWTRGLRNFDQAVLAFACAIMLASCGEVGEFGSPQKDFTTSDVLELHSPVRNFIAVASDVGKSLGYDLAGVDAAHNTVTLANNPNMGMIALIGKMEASRVVLTLEPDGHEVKIDMSLSGNFDTATPDAAASRLAKLKAALTAAFQS